MQGPEHVITWILIGRGLGLVAAVSAFELVTFIDTFRVYFDALLEKYD